MFAHVNPIGVWQAAMKIDFTIMAYHKHISLLLFYKAIKEFNGTLHGGAEII